jgi:hypothetical protein
MLILGSESVANDPRLGLLVSLFRDAQAEREVDFAFFRYWNLLEVVAATQIPAGRPVTDFSGSPLMDGTKGANTASPRGRVYESLKRLMTLGAMSESSFVSAPAQNLWDTVGMWYGFRHAAAHHGGFRVGDAVQSRQPWYRLALSAVEHLRSAGIPRRPDSDPYLVSLKLAAQMVVFSQFGVGEGWPDGGTSPDRGWSPSAP